MGLMGLSVAAPGPVRTARETQRGGHAVQMVKRDFPILLPLQSYVTGRCWLVLELEILNGCMVCAGCVREGS